jgi:hypothetical protein
VDIFGYVWFVPDGAFADGKASVSNPPFVVWNSAAPFSQSSSWTAYPGATALGAESPSSGAAYDPSTNTAYTAPNQATIVQVQEAFLRYQEYLPLIMRNFPGW